MEAIGEAFLKTHPYYNDIISTYDYTLESFKHVIGEDHAFKITFGANTEIDCAFVNAKIYAPTDEYVAQFNPGMPVLPFEAITSRETYSALMTADLSLGEAGKIIPNYLKFKVPVPIGSKYSGLSTVDPKELEKMGEDFKDFYGYFIIGGNLKSLIPCYKKPFNHPITVKNMYKNQISRLEGLYSKEMDYDDSFYIACCMLAGTPEYFAEDFICSLQLANPKMKARVEKTSYSVVNIVPFRYLFWAFGAKSDAEILDYIDPSKSDKILRDAFINAVLYGKEHNRFANEHDITNLNQVKAVQIIADDILLPSLSADEKFKEMTRIFKEEFMPGIGAINPKTTRNKAVCIELGRIVRSLYRVGMSIDPPEAKEALPNRRILAGNQMIKDFKSFYRVAIRGLLHELANVKNVKTIIDIILRQSAPISNRISSSMYKVFNSVCGLTGNINQKTRTEAMNTRNYAYLKSKLRQIVITQTMADASLSINWSHRTVSPNDMFFICPVQSPESGKQIGLYRDPTIYTFISLPVESRYYKDALVDHIGEFSFEDDYKYTITVNGSILCWVKDPDAAFVELKKFRQTYTYVDDNGFPQNILTISIARFKDKIDIWSDMGRLMCLFVCAKAFLDSEFYEWMDKLRTDLSLFNIGFERGWIEYLDSEMVEQNCCVAYNLEQYQNTPKYFTHVALPGGMHSFITNLVPGINLNPVHRELLITCHVKQEIGRYCKYPMMLETACLALTNCQVPIIRTCLYDMLGMVDHPMTNNVLIAFMYYGHNQEDCMIVSQASVDRGLFRIVSYSKEYYSTVSADEMFYKPSSSSKLSSKGAPIDVSIAFEEGEEILGLSKVVNDKNIDISVKNTISNGPEYDDRKLRSCCLTEQNDKTIQTSQLVTYAEFMNPHQGDKLTPETAQKGTIGKLYAYEDLPFTREGIRPDIIFNPASVLKRATISHLAHTRWATLVSLLCTQGNWTPYFTKLCDHEIDEMFKKMGVDPSGRFEMWNPITGEKYGDGLYFGNHIYGRQPHNVEQKFIVRDTDKLNAFGLPEKGRQRGGGQSVDRMTMYAEAAAGITDVMLDFRIETNKPLLGGWCANCHSFGIYQRSDGVVCCPTCGPITDFELTRLPAASQYLEHSFEVLGFQMTN